MRQPLLARKPENTTHKQGEWRDGILHGDGVLRDSDGGEYTGTWHAGRRHGKGTQVGRDGEVYKGQWVGDQRHGEGEVRYPDGSRYDGEWSRGEPPAWDPHLRVSC